jgi:tRNA A37 N6-isopentenylltransferase MiaA
MDLDGMDYDDLLFILKKQKYSEWLKKYQEIKPESEMKMQENDSEWLKKYQEIKHESEMKMQNNTYREMLHLLKLIKPNCLTFKIKLRHLPSDAFMKKTV